MCSHVVQSQPPEAVAVSLTCYSERRKKAFFKPKVSPLSCLETWLSFGPQGTVV